MSNRSPSGTSRGFSLIELVVASAISLVVVLLATQAIVRVDHDQFLRKTVTELQGAARTALTVMEKDLRAASLTAGSGVVWTASGGNAVGRPAVQIFTGVGGGGTLDVKPGTDVLLVVAARPGATAARSATVGTLTSSTLPIPLTDAGRFVVPAGTTLPVLLGDYGDASWGVVGGAISGGTVQQITLADQVVNVFPAQQIRQLNQGSSVREAQAHLYYVDINDELVLLRLTVPRAPRNYAEAISREVLGRGFENMQLGCQLDNGTGALAPCPAPMAGDPAPGDPLRTESTAAFGAFGAGGGPRLTTAISSPSRVMLLRNVTVNVSVRSTHSVDRGQGDPKIPLGAAQVTLPVGGASDAAAYVRRAYQLSASPRNTSLGVF